MDILKIRKRLKEKIEEADSEAPEAAEPKPPAAPEASEPEPPAPEPEPAPPTRVPLAVDVEDPLRDFLARYDLEDGLFAQATPDAGRDLDRPRYLAFGIEDEEYAVSIMDVREILRVVTLTEVPRSPAQILGVLSKRGVVMPIIDLGAALGLREPSPKLEPRQRVLVVGNGSRVAGLRVDDLHEVVEFQSEDIEDVPASLGSRSVHYLRGLGRSSDRMFILLDVDEVLQSLAPLESTESA